MEKKEKYLYVTDGQIWYIFNSKKITIDDFLCLEYTAALENEYMRHKIFFVYKLSEGLKVFTSLN